MRRLTLTLALVAGALLTGCTVDEADGSRARVYGGGPAYSPGTVYGGPLYGYGAPSYGYYGGSAYGYGGPSYGYYGGPAYGYGRQVYRHDEPGYRDEPKAPWRDHDRRFDRQGENVVCDRLTNVCYKKGNIDASETRDRFGNHAGRRVDGIQDRNRTNDVFLPKPGIICNDRDNVCKKGGEPNRRLTRDYFGNQAARRVAPGPGRNDSGKGSGSRVSPGANQQRAPAFLLPQRGTAGRGGQARSGWNR